MSWLRDKPLAAPGGAGRKSRRRRVRPGVTTPSIQQLMKVSAEITGKAVVDPPMAAASCSRFLSNRRYRRHDRQVAVVAREAALPDAPASRMPVRMITLMPLRAAELRGNRCADEGSLQRHLTNSCCRAALDQGAQLPTSSSSHSFSGAVESARSTSRTGLCRTSTGGSSRGIWCNRPS